MSEVTTCAAPGRRRVRLTGPERRRLIYDLERTCCIHVEGGLYRCATRAEAEAIVDGLPAAEVSP